jgi:hypothetical protein
LLAPLKIGTALALTYGTAISALGAKAINAAAADEKLISRLTMVYGSAKKAEQIFSQLEGKSMGGMFDADQLTEAMIVMRGFGMDSMKNLGIVAAAARAADAGISELAQGIATLQMRNLKRLGIEMESSGEGMVIKWRDKMQKMRRVTTKDADATRRALMEIFNLKFGSSFSGGTLHEL